MSERQLCLACLRSIAVCDCAEIRQIRPDFRVVLLQHPKERKNTIGTARLTHLCLGNSKLIPGTEFASDPQVNALLDDPTHFSVLLFPGEESLNLSEDPNAFARLPEAVGKKLTVFVIDGTWPQAKGMVRKTPRLAALPRVCFTPDLPSQYKVRRQPNRYCLSTIEAVHRLIGILEPARDASQLLTLFGKMVDRQVKCGGLNLLRENQKPRPAPEPSS